MPHKLQVTMFLDPRFIYLSVFTPEYNQLTYWLCRKIYVAATSEPCQQPTNQNKTQQQLSSSTLLEPHQKKGRKLLCRIHVSTRGYRSIRTPESPGKRIIKEFKPLKGCWNQLQQWHVVSERMLVEKWFPPPFPDCTLKSEQIGSISSSKGFRGSD